MAVAPALVAGGGAGGLGMLSSGLSVLGGLAGLGGSKGSRRQADSYRDAAAELLQLRGVGQRAGLGAALSYDPAREDEAAINAARKDSARTFGNAYGSITSRFRRAGGDVGGDTRVGMQLAGAAGTAFDPLAKLEATLGSTRTMRKIGALSQAVDTGGDVTGQYLGLADEADRNAGNVGDSLSLISGGLAGFGKRRAPVRATGGSDASSGGATPARATSYAPRWKPRTAGAY